MATLSDMIDEVQSNLAGYTLRQDRITYLATEGGIGTTDTVLKVGNQNNLAKGIIEIDDELLWVDTFDKTTGTMNVIPGFGRGYFNTTPAPHSQYAKVTLSPTFTRVAIKNAINDAVNSVFPKLFSAASHTFTFNPTQLAYAIPDDADTILAVTWQTIGPTKEWAPVKRWRIDAASNAAAFGSTASITIYDAIYPGATVQVWYMTEPNTLDSGTDEFADVTGLPNTSKDVIVYGACYRLLSFLDAGRINLTSAEADAADSKIPSTAGASSSKFIYALYQNRLNDEAAKLITKFPVRVHYNR